MGALADRQSIKAFERLDGPKQHARARSFLLARDIEHEPAPVNEIDVGVPVFEKERGVSLRPPAIGMCRRISDDVCFRLDNATCPASCRKIVDERGADQETR